MTAANQLHISPKERLSAATLSGCYQEVANP